MVRATAIALVAATFLGCASRTPWGRAALAPPAAATRVVAIEVTRHGFEPKRIVVQSGETVTFTFTRRVERTCVTSVVISLDAEERIERELLVDEAVAITLRFDAPGELGMSCPMDMYGATIEVR